MQELGVMHFQCALAFMQGWTGAKQLAAWNLQRQYGPGVSLQFFQSGSYQVSQWLLHKWILCPQFPWLVSLLNEKYVATEPIHIMQRLLGKWLKHQIHLIWYSINSYWFWWYQHFFFFSDYTGHKKGYVWSLLSLCFNIWNNIYLLYYYICTEHLLVYLRGKKKMCGIKCSCSNVNDEKNLSRAHSTIYTL